MIRKYFISSNLWQSDYLDEKNIVEIVSFGLYAPKRIKEMYLEWKVNGDGKLHLLLQCSFENSSLLIEFHDVFKKVEKISDDITSQQFCEILDSCGFINATPQVEDYEEEE